jgi:ankyrin repeat protein
LNQDEVVRTLLEYDTQNYAVNHEDESGRLPIIVACKHNSPSEEVILSLLQVTDPACLKKADDNESLPLHIAAGAGDAIPVSVIEKMLEINPEATSVMNKRKGKLFISL